MADIEQMRALIKQFDESMITDEDDALRAAQLLRNANGQKEQAQVKARTSDRSDEEPTVMRH